MWHHFYSWRSAGGHVEMLKKTLFAGEAKVVLVVLDCLDHLYRSVWGWTNARHIWWTLQELQPGWSRSQRADEENDCPAREDFSSPPESIRHQRRTPTTARSENLEGGRVRSTTQLPCCWRFWSWNLASFCTFFFFLPKGDSRETRARWRALPRGC